MALVHELARRLTGCRITKSGDVSRIVFEVDGCWLDARVREAPRVEVYVRTVAVPGLTLRLRPRGTVEPLRRFRFDAHLDVDGADTELGQLWLDEPARDAIVAALWLGDDAWVPGHAHVGGYDTIVERGEVLVTRSSELEPDRLATAVRAAAVLASRPHRIARGWLEVARTLGGTTTTDRWDLGKDFAVTVDRGAVTVLIDNLLDGDGRLCTRMRARRIGVADRSRLSPADWALLADAAPNDDDLDGDPVTLIWRGMVHDRDRLGPAIEFCARLAAPRGETHGPYR